MKQNNQWFKSSYSNGQSACVEARLRPRAVNIRDSKASEGPVLVFGDTAWMAFLNLTTDEG